MKKTDMKISDIKNSELRHLAELRHKEYCDKKNIDMTVDYDKKLTYAFSFSETEEGSEFWHDVLNGMMDEDEDEDKIKFLISLL